MGTFESLAHTADVGFHARGESLDDLFATAAAAMLSVEYDLGSVPLEEEHPVTAEGADLEATLFAWLSELIWLHDTSGFAPGRVRAEVRVGNPDDPDGYEVDGWAEGAPMGDWFEQTGPQVKAVTMHGLSVTPAGAGQAGSGRGAGTGAAVEGAKAVDAVKGPFEATVYLDV
ncbi:MAG: archease [Actinomycetota bacterium]